MLRQIATYLAQAFLVVGGVDTAYAHNAQEILANAYAERAKVKTIDYSFTTRTESGTIVLSNVITDGRKLYLDRQTIEKGVVPDGLTAANGIQVFDGTRVYKKNGKNIRTYRSTATRRYASPVQVAFQWMASAMMVGENVERLSEWELWSDYAATVTSVSEHANGIWRLRAQELPAPIDYHMVYFDSSRNFYPVKYEAFRDGTCIVEAEFAIEMFTDVDGTEIAFPIAATYRTHSGPGSYNSWTTHEVNTKALRINPRVREAQFTLASLSGGDVFVDVDEMNERLAENRSHASRSSRYSYLAAIIAVLGVLFFGFKCMRRRRA